MFRNMIGLSGSEQIDLAIQNQAYFEIFMDMGRPIEKINEKKPEIMYLIVGDDFKFICQSNFLLFV